MNASSQPGWWNRIEKHPAKAGLLAAVITLTPFFVSFLLRSPSEPTTDPAVQPKSEGASAQELRQNLLLLILNYETEFQRFSDLVEHQLPELWTSSRSLDEAMLDDKILQQVLWLREFLQAGGELPGHLSTLTEADVVHVPNASLKRYRSTVSSQMRQLEKQKVALDQIVEAKKARSSAP